MKLIVAFFIFVFGMSATGELINARIPQNSTLESQHDSFILTGVHELIATKDGTIIFNSISPFAVTVGVQAPLSAVNDAGNFRLEINVTEATFLYVFTEHNEIAINGSVLIRTLTDPGTLLVHVIGLFAFSILGPILLIVSYLRE